MTDKPTPKKRRTGQHLSARERATAQAKFLARLCQDANVEAASAAAGIHKDTAYQWRKASDVFRQAWEDAIAQAVGELETVAIQRAKEISDTLLIFLLKAHKPEKYREMTRSVHEHSGPAGQPIAIQIDHFDASAALAAATAGPGEDREDAS